MLQTITIIVEGRVQGVFYRQSTFEKASLLGVAGTVRNLPDGKVHIRDTGTKAQLDDLFEWCKQGPPRAAVNGVEWKDEPLQLFDGFRVLRREA